MLNKNNTEKNPTKQLQKPRTIQTDTYYTCTLKKKKKFSKPTQSHYYYTHVHKN